MQNKKYRGELGEAAFFYFATRAGFCVLTPVGEKSVYDFLIDNGRDILRVQVKSSEVLNSKSTYHIKVQHGGNARRATYGKEEIDVVAAFLIPEETFYIFPVEAVQGRTALSLPSAARRNKGRHPGRHAQYHEAFHLLEPSAWTPNRNRRTFPTFRLLTMLDPPPQHAI